MAIKCLLLFTMFFIINVNGCPPGFIPISGDLCAGLSLNGTQVQAVQDCYKKSDRYDLTFWQIMMENYTLFSEIYSQLLQTRNINEIWTELISNFEDGHFFLSANLLNSLSTYGYRSPVLNLNLTSNHWDDGSCLTWNVAEMTYTPRSCKNNSYNVVCLAGKNFLQRHTSSPCPDGFSMAPRHGPFCFHVDDFVESKLTWSQATEVCSTKYNSHIIQKAFPAVYHNSSLKFCPLGIRRIIGEDSDLYVWSNDTNHIAINDEVNSYYMEFLESNTYVSDDTYGVLHYIDSQKYQEIPYGHRWSLTNSSAEFDCLACEIPANIADGKPKLKLQVVRSDIEENGHLRRKIQLKLSVTNRELLIHSEQHAPLIQCFSDSWLLKEFRIIYRDELIFTPTEEGFYWCLGYSLLTSSPVLSNKVPVKLAGPTLAVMLEVLNPPVTCESLIEFFNSSEATELRKILSLQLTSEYVNVTLKRITYNCSNVLLHVKQDLSDFINYEPFQIEQYTFQVVYVRSTTSCPAEQHWNQTLIGRRISHSDSKIISTRKCEGDFISGAHWGSVSWKVKSHTQNNDADTATVIDTICPDCDAYSEYSTQSMTPSFAENIEETLSLWTNKLNSTTKISSTTEIDSTTEISSVHYETSSEEYSSSVNISQNQHVKPDILSTVSFTVESTNNDLSNFSISDTVPTTPPLSLPSDIPISRLSKLNATAVCQIAATFHGISRKPARRSDLNEAVTLLNDLLDSNLTVLREQPPEKNLLQDIDTLLNRVSLESEHVKIVHTKVAIYVHDISEDDSFVGIALTANNPLEKNINGDLISLKSLDDETPKDIDVLIRFPKFNSSSRVSIAVFSDDTAFHTAEEYENVNITVNSRIVSVTVNDSNNLNDTFLPYIDISFRPMENTSMVKSCAFWEFHSGFLGMWSTAGCELLSENLNGLDVCRCYHLTHFAEIIIGNNPDFSESQHFALDIISAVGCTLSLLGFLGIIITACVFPQWRRQTGNQILLNISVSVAFNMVIFLTIALGVIGEGDSTSCIVIGACLHYSLLTSFSWMLVAAILQYIRLVKVFGGPSTSHLLLKTSIFAWGVPLIPIGILLLIDINLYSAFDNLGKNRDFCFPTGISFYSTVVGPISLILLVNIIIFIAIMLNICNCGRDKSIRRHVLYSKSYTIRRLIMAVLLVFLFGLTWVFGFFSYIIVFTYLFCLTATLQGLVLFVFFVFVEGKTRRMWFPKTEIPSHTNRTQSSSDTTGMYVSPEEVTPLRSNFRNVSSRSGNLPMSQRAEITEW